MKAIQITEAGKTRLIDVAKPELKHGEVLLKINYVGFCGSDLNTFRGLNPLVKLPIVPGHEIGATIVEVSDGVPSELKPDMHCTVNPYTSCGCCPACLNGRSNACQNNETFGVQRNGAMQEYLAVPWQKVIADGQISPRDFALVEPMSVGFHAVARAEVSDLDTVMVIGCGMIGLGAIVRAALRGARVVAVDVDDQKLSLAQRLGAKYAINSALQDVHQRVQEITNGRGVDVVIEAVGRPETYVLAINEVCFTGRVVYIGYAKADVAFNTSLFVKKELDIRGTRNAMPSDFRAVMEYMKRCESPVDEFVTAIYKPEQAQHALEDWQANPSKVFRLLIEF